MKPIRPTRHYDADAGYPSVVDVDLSRRGFLGAALAGSAGLGALLLVPDGARAGRKRGLEKVTLRLYYRVRCKHRLRHRLDQVVVASYDRRFVAYLRKGSERAGILKGIRAALKTTRCADLTHHKRRAVLQRSLGRVLVRLYRKRTSRRARKPAVTVIWGRPPNHSPIDGGISTPTRPELSGLRGA